MKKEFEMNTKVFSFGVDEDSLTFETEFDSLESYFKVEGIRYCGYFLDKYNTEVVNNVTVQDKEELFDYDEGELELAKFDEMVAKYDSFLKNNSDYVLINYCIEYDISWVLMSKVDYAKFLELCELEVANEE